MVPIEDCHQFLTSDVEFILNDNTLHLHVSNEMHKYTWNDIRKLKFSLFRSTDKNGQSIPFVQLMYLWATKSHRLHNDPFLSYRHYAGLTCLLYSILGYAFRIAEELV
jgi:hypothetical protein